jgi:multidrug efflux pump subunit AcrA (membrane-fusion protein)
VNIDQVFVQFYLDPKFMQTLQLEQPVTVRFPVVANAAFTGKISFIDPRIDAGSGLFRIKVLIDNPDHQIKAGMRGVADFAKLQK